MTGRVPNMRFSFMTRWLFTSMKRSLFTSRRSEQFLTGKNRARGTLIPCAFLKYLIADPAAVSSYWYWVKWQAFNKPRSSIPVKPTVHPPTFYGWLWFLALSHFSPRHVWGLKERRDDFKLIVSENGLCLPLRLIHRLLVLKILNLRTRFQRITIGQHKSPRFTLPELNSSENSCGTWASSSSRIVPS